MKVNFLKCVKRKRIKINLETIKLSVYTSNLHSCKTACHQQHYTQSHQINAKSLHLHHLYLYIHINLCAFNGNLGPELQTKEC